MIKKLFILLILTICTVLPSMAMSDPHDLERFTKAQNQKDPKGTVYSKVLQELKAGKKTSHWIWYIFPQVDGLGSSSMSKQYAIKSIDEAREYLKHPVLGKRLEECIKLVLGVKGSTVDQIFGYPDTMKVQSSLTLFAEVSNDPNSVFAQALKALYKGKRDQKTLNILNAMKNGTHKTKPDQGKGHNSGKGGANATNQSQDRSYITLRNGVLLICSLGALWLCYRYWRSTHEANPSKNVLDKD